MDASSRSSDLAALPGRETDPSDDLALPYRHGTASQRTALKEHHQNDGIIVLIRLDTAAEFLAIADRQLQGHSVGRIL